MKSRREVLKSMALGIGLAVPAAIAAKKVAGSDAQKQSETGNKLAVAQADTPAPWQLFSPIAQGGEIAHGWSLTGLSGAVAGAFNLRLTNVDGRGASVHICLKDEFSSGLTQTEQLDLVLMNGGESDAASDEDVAQVLQVLATHMRENELAMSSDTFAGLLSHEERVNRFANDPKFQGVLV